MLARTTLLLALTMGAAVLTIPPTAAHHDLCPGNTHALTGTVSGTVWSGNPDNWLLTVTRPASIVRLDPTSPSDGDADLYIYDSTCTVLICSSAVGGSAVDICAVPAGAYQVRVVYFSSSTGQVSYNLSAT